jgi:hypothetical protein
MRELYPKIEMGFEIQLIFQVKIGLNEFLEFNEYVLGLFYISVVSHALKHRGYELSFY